MTQTDHVTAREAVYQILREAFRLGLELRPKTLRSRAALPYERIYESLIPLQKIKELQRRRMALDAANTCAPSTPEPAIRSRISHPIRDISSCTSRARVFLTSRVRALGVYGCVRIRDCPRRPWNGTTVWPAIATSQLHSATGRRRDDGVGTTLPRLVCPTSSDYHGSAALPACYPRPVTPPQSGSLTYITPGSPGGSP